MNDLRYHALTIMGIFLALAVGLMLGSTLGSPERKERVYEGLQRQFELLRVQNQEVRDENDAVRRQLVARDRALRELLPVAVRDRLPGSVIGVILCGSVDERPFWNDLQTAIRLAGAELGPVARIPDRLRALDPALRSRFARTWKPSAPPDLPEPFEEAGWLVEALARGGPAASLEELARATGIELRGDTRRPVRRLLVLTSAADETRAVAVTAGNVPEARVVDVAQERGLRVVAAEPQGAGRSAVEPLRDRNISTIDDVDTPSGQISAVLALAGAEGRFGSRPGATRPIPPLETP
jgi:hypothetical protein